MEGTQQPAQKPLLVFVCTSNTCRSPMAQAFAQAWLQRHGMQERYRVVSRGITDAYEPPGSPASEFGVAVLAQTYGLDTSAHRSALLTESEARDAHAIIGVTQSHVQAVARLFPGVESKLHSLARNVPDPWHGPVEAYQACAAAMQPLVEDVMQRLLAPAAP